MTAMLVGPAPYIYVCTRMRVRKSKLIPRDEYLRMLNMGLPEITRFIEETEYKTEIDELGTSFSGIDLIEIGLSWNLAKEYQRILEIAPGFLKKFTTAYLRRWDIHNVLTVIRGKMQGMSQGKIKEVLIPAGELDKVFLDRLLAEETPERIVEALKGQKLYPILARDLPSALADGSLARLENELYKQFYSDLLIDARSGVKGGKQFEEFIRLDIDITNIKSLFRLRADNLQEDARDMMIPGAAFSVEEFQRLTSMENLNEFIDSIKNKIRLQSLLEIMDEFRETQSVRQIEVALIRVQLKQMERMAKIYPFSIHPILSYLEMKKYEVFNLRALARGKESNLEPESIKGYLVM
jgi:V/A-type H+-transporting ATPase subunit C